MNTKRFFGIFILVGGVIAIGAIIWWLVNQGKSTPETEPAQLPTQLPITDPNTGRQIKEEASKPVDPQSPEEKERQAQEALKRQAVAFAARYGTYSNTDDFSSWLSLGIDITAGVQPFLQTERQRLNKEHPSKNGYWGQTTKSLSTRITSELPLLGKDRATVTVQAQQIVSAATGSGPVTSYQEITLEYQKVKDVWLVSRITSNPLEL